MSDFGIIMLSFGTTYADTRKKNIHALTTLVREEYPEIPVLEAFSSARVRKVLRERDGMMIRSIEEAMEEMKHLGVEKLAVCPTHILGGHEYEKCKALVEERSSWFEKISFGNPLLGCEEDYPKVAKAFCEGFSSFLQMFEPKGASIVRSKNCHWQFFFVPMQRNVPMVLMGHGTNHEADVSYEKLEKALQEYSGQKVYIATVEGSVGIDDVVKKLERDYGDSFENPGTNEKLQVLVTPFMLVAGDHANNDMAGEEDSFASVLKEHGFEPVCILKGIGEYPEIQNLYLEKIEKQLKK